MAAMIALTIADNSVSHTFSPVGIDSNGIAKWSDRSSGSILAFSNFTLASRLPSKSARTTKVTGKLVVPVMNVDGTKNFDGVFNFDFVLHENCTEAQRDVLLAMARDALNESVVTNAVKYYEAPF